MWGKPAACQCNLKSGAAGKAPGAAGEAGDGGGWSGCSIGARQNAILAGLMAVEKAVSAPLSLLQARHHAASLPQHLSLDLQHDEALGDRLGRQGQIADKLVLGHGAGPKPRKDAVM